MAAPRLSYRRGSDRGSLAPSWGVVDVSKGNNHLRVRLADGRTIMVHPFAYVRVGDMLEIQWTGEVPTRLWKVVGNKQNGRGHDRFPVWPPYSVVETVELP